MQSRRHPYTHVRTKSPTHSIQWAAVKTTPGVMSDAPHWKIFFLAKLSMLSSFGEGRTSWMMYKTHMWGHSPNCVEANLSSVTYKTYFKVTIHRSCKVSDPPGPINRCPVFLFSGRDGHHVWKHHWNVSQIWNYFVSWLFLHLFTIAEYVHCSTLYFSSIVRTWTVKPLLLCRPHFGFGVISGEEDIFGGVENWIMSCKITAFVHNLH